MSLPHDEIPLAPGIPGDGADSQVAQRSPLLTRWLVRAVVAWLAVALLSSLRAQFPDWFPPRTFIR